MNTDINLSHNIVNVSLQEASNRHKVVPSILYGGLYSTLNGVLAFDAKTIELIIHKKTLAIDLANLERVKFSITFRKHTIRNLPVIMAYVDIVITHNDGKSFEVNTTDYEEVLSFIDTLQSQNVNVIDDVELVKMLNAFKDKKDGFYNYMQEKGEQVAKKYNLEYPSITFDRKAK